MQLLTLKLERWIELPATAQSALAELATASWQRKVMRGQTLAKEGSRARAIFLIKEGWALRYKALISGRRQAVGLLMPGDLSDVRTLVWSHSGHDVEMISDGLVTEIRPNDLQTLVDEHPAVARAIWWTTLMDESTLREWLARVGARDAYSRTAHLFCEIVVRAQASRHGDDQSVATPLNQNHLADILGITVVHVNRTLRRLKSDGLLTLNRGTITVHDFGALQAAAEFNGNYLKTGD